MIVQGPAVVEWARDKFGLVDFGPAVGIGLVRNNAYRAATLYNGYTGTNICMHVVSDGSRHWLNKTYLRAVFEYAFVTLGCLRATTIIESTNKDSIRFAEHLGFKPEGVMQNACPGGDLLIHRLYRHEFKFLELSHGQTRRAHAA